MQMFVNKIVCLWSKSRRSGTVRIFPYLQRTSPPSPQGSPLASSMKESFVSVDATLYTSEHNNDNYKVVSNYQSSTSSKTFFRAWAFSFVI